MKAVLACCLAAVAAVVHAIDPPRFPHQPIGGGDELLNYNITVASPGQLRASTTSVVWANSGTDGDFITKGADGSLVFQNVASGDVREFLAVEHIPAGMVGYTISADLSKVLWAVNSTKQYRHSFFASYLVQDVQSGKTQQLVEGAADIQLAAWNPVSSSQIAFVRGNNLFVWDSGTVTQVTTDGGPDVFNAVPDWVYEEEILGDNSALWYSPDGQYLAYLSFNETGVETFTVPYYMNEQTLAPSYPRELEIRYPKVGTKNPTVGFNLLRLSDFEISSGPVDAFPADDLVIGEVAWLTDGHDRVLYRAFNRVQDREKLVVIDTASGSTTTIRERDGSDGWLENKMAINYVGDIEGVKYYLDMSDESGWNHLYLVSIDGSKQIALTSGEWEVVSIVKVDAARGLIYYTSTEHHSTERHLYSVSWITRQKKALVADTVPAVWGASFSTEGGYYILRYAGPDVPYQELYSINDTATPIRTIQNNTRLHSLLKTYNLPNITYLEIPLAEGNYTLNAMLRLPVNLDITKKYPVLLTPYGGPGAQEVSKAMASFGWSSYIASDPELQYITLTVDNRGTGYKGRAFRCSVASNLGTLEAADQIHAAKWLAANFPFVDADKIGIWGWSYGGYLTAKVIEANDAIISYGIATAPVSDWRFYDSMYTERYMKTPATNAEGYNRSAVRKTEGFKRLPGGFLVQHGTGDDNVHFQNAAVLVDLLMGAKVGPDKFEAAYFTDSDHSIARNGANMYLYKQLTEKLYKEKKRVVGGAEKHQWSKKKRSGRWGGRKGENSV
ncbi:dipeptidyl peptidase IV N-terminal region-domain-containing protein [Cercophora newfieldiana]|uniref:Probable dipeptidyl-aminopeptidase B n=1 Tax=Cercophora newfieldiana TaxID=92897 RepID=A0AA39Y1A5_9PEZI|nr:dipeptidyl peptidase IV N-terminal region-domain-containing protein [Cercophora newfieldiana]